MSNAIAIAAVTTVLRNLLDQHINADPRLNVTTITTLPPEEARNRGEAKQLNIFLYHLGFNAAWRNMDIPRQTRPGERGLPALPLNLYYMLTVYSRDINEEGMQFSHRVLGRAMNILHDHPVLSLDEIRTGLPAEDRASFTQFERMRIVPQPLNLEEMSKLWTMFQSQYRLSTAYEVSVTLIESDRPMPAPLPVLRRGRQDRGVDSLVSAAPTLTSIEPNIGQSGLTLSGRLGDELIVKGHALGGSDLTVRFTSPKLASALTLAPLPGGNDTELRVRLPAPDSAEAQDWAAGFYTVALVVTRPNLPSWTTNEVPFALAPLLTVSPNTAPAGAVTLTVTCRPRLRPNQTAVLLFGDRQVAPSNVSTPSDPAQPTTLTFDIQDVAQRADPYVVRLRVDGVDSVPLAQVPPGQPLALDFDPAQMVTIQ